MTAHKGQEEDVQLAAYSSGREVKQNAGNGPVVSVCFSPRKRLCSSQRAALPLPRVRGQTGREAHLERNFPRLLMSVRKQVTLVSDQSRFTATNLALEVLGS